MTQSLPPAGLRLEAQNAAGFDAALRAANKSVSGFGQVVTGVYREIGAVAVRELARAGREAMRFAEDTVRASLKGSEFEKVTGSLNASLIELTKVSLGPFFDQLASAASKAAPGLLGVVQAAEQYLGGMGQSALAWGQNTVTQFAQGIVNGAVEVINALASIANEVAYWLQPGSPPRLLPDIDQWGAGAITAWAQGFSKADFSTFGEIAKTVENTMRSLAVSNDAGLIPAILGSRNAIAQAVAAVQRSGQVTQATLNSVFAALGPTTQAMKDYVASTLRLTLANKAVGDLEAQMQSLTDAQQALMDEGRIGQLQLVAGDPNATRREKELAKLEIERLKTGGKLAIAKKEQSAAQTQFDLAKAKVDLELETNNLLKEQLALMDRISAAAAGHVGAVAKPAGGGGASIARPKIIKPDMGWLAGLRAQFDQPLKDLKTAWDDLWDKIRPKMQPTIDAINNRLIPSFNALLAAAQEKMPLVKSEIAKTLAFMIDQTALAAPTMVENFSKWMDAWADIIRNHSGTLIRLTGGIVRLAFSGFLQIVNTAVAAAALGVATLATVLDTGSLLLQGKWDEAGNRLVEGFKTDWAIIVDTAKTNWDLLLANFGTSTDELMGKAGAFLDDLKARWATAWGEIRAKGDEIWSSITGKVTEAIGSVFGAVTSKMDELNPAWRDDWELVKTAARERWDGVVADAKLKLAEVLASVDGKLDEIKQRWQVGWDTVRAVVGAVWILVKEDVDKGLADVKKAISDQLQSFRELGQNIINGIRDGINDALAGLVETAARAALAALQAAKDALLNKSPSKRAADEVGRPFVQGIIKGMAAELVNLRVASMAVAGGMIAPPASAAHILAGNISNTYSPSTTLHYAPNYTTPTRSPQHDFAIIQAMVGGG